MTRYLKDQPKHRYMPRKEKIREMFDDISKDYDRLNHILSLDIDAGWRRKAVREIICPGKRLDILDVACGTGDFSICIANADKEGSLVTGIDISEGMLEVGRKKTAAAGLDGKVRLTAGDCEKMSFEDCSFDRVSVAFGVRNFENLEAGLKEMLRVLKPGGKAVILELSVPSSGILRALYKMYFLHILPAIGGMVSGNRGAYRYLPASVLRFPSPERFTSIMEDCGYSHVARKSFTMGICRMYVGTKA